MGSRVREGWLTVIAGINQAVISQARVKGEVGERGRERARGGEVGARELRLTSLEPSKSR